MKLGVAGLLLALASMGCAQETPRQEVPRVFEGRVIIQSEMEAYRIQAVLSALSEWENVAGSGMRVSAEVRPTAELLALRDDPGVIRVFGSGHVPEGFDCGLGPSLSVLGSMFVLEGTPTVCLRDGISEASEESERRWRLSTTTAAHELGHAFGLGHRDGGVMAANHDIKILYITTQDREQFCSMWDC